MKGKCISIHSSRGGTGKTLITTNLAVLYAKNGLNVAILDLDFRAPSLSGIFKKITLASEKYWINDYLNGKCKAQEVVTDVSKEYGVKGKLLIGFANPKVEAVRDMTEKSRAWEVASLRKLISLRIRLFKEMGIDCIFLDTSPGVQYSSVNAVIGSDLSIIVTTLDSLDLTGTEDMLSQLYDEFEQKTAVLINKVLFPNNSSNGKKIEQVIKRFEHELKRPVLGTIACYCDVLKTDRADFIVLDRPDHPFVKDLKAVASKLEKIKLKGEMNIGN